MGQLHFYRLGLNDVFHRTEARKQDDDDQVILGILGTARAIVYALIVRMPLGTSM